ncbi:MAG: ComEC/Rec2 family competence protein [Candidatus Colwellbacteria bacterium]|nr:ComEC/Rec2 family competence protein [Candidatus Colwellbacteria bacterium]
MRIHDLAFYLAAFFIVGIAAAGLKINVWLILVLSPLLGAAIFYLKKKKTLALLTLIIPLGFFYYHFYAALNQESITYGKEITFQGLITREPKYGLRSQTLNVELAAPYKGELIVYLSPYPEFHYGDLLEFKGEISKNAFDKNVSSFPKIKLIALDQGSSFISFLFGIKGKLIGNLERILTLEKSALISGLLFGERAEFSKEFTEALAKSGTTHIVALSGYNISIIGITLATALGYILNRRKAFYISLFFIVAFVLMTGAEPSVVRAAIMGVILLLAEHQSRIYSFRNAITITAFVMLILDPKLLVFDLAFKLSFAALLGIVYLQPLVIKGASKVYEKAGEPGRWGWRKNLIQTFSAQVAVAPIILTTFGYLSPFSLLANVLILEFIPLTMGLGFAAAVLGIFSYELSLIVGWLLGLLLGYEIFIINLFSFNWL